MTCYTSALSTAAYAGVASHPPSTAAVRLFSLHNKLAARSATSKIVHLVRHAEGTHNLSEEQSKLPAHFDATLTPKGVEQCNNLAQRTRNLEVEAVLVSPMTRCLETARFSFPHLYDDAGDDGTTPNATNKRDVHFVAHEEWRETVNFLCDTRRPTHVLEKEYPRVSFDSLAHDHDPIWAAYEEIHGSYTDHTSMRESGDPASLYNRSHAAWRVLLNRPERHLALVGHSAFFMHNFMPYHEELMGVVQYHDEDVKELMTSARFDNCELRSVVVDVPI